MRSVSVGHHGRATVVYFGAEGAVASVDVRGGGPGTRETDLLEPHNTVERVHAITLAGGSAFGLAAADGAMRTLAEAGIGFGLGDVVVPIVPGAVIFDLFFAPDKPTAADGAAACAHAMAGDDTREGSIGAGLFATAGKLRGGLGRAEVTIPVNSVEPVAPAKSADSVNPAQPGAGAESVPEAVPSAGYTVGCVLVANPVGEMIDPATGQLWADPNIASVDAAAYAEMVHPAAAHLNTTIGVVYTDAPVTKAQAKRLALSAHDGIARAVRPAHSPLDGDTLFAASTGDGSGVSVEAMTALCAAGAEVVAQAMARAVVAAEPSDTLTAYTQLLG